MYKKPYTVTGLAVIRLCIYIITTGYRFLINLLCFVVLQVLLLGRRVVGLHVNINTFNYFKKITTLFFTLLVGVKVATYFIQILFITPLLTTGV
jgi:hypothetical protein